MQYLSRIIEPLWYRKKLPFYLYPLIPLSWIFRFLITVRKTCYHLNLPGFKTHHFPLPIIVVGNITIGGTGKTPLIIHLYHLLKSHGFTPGIVSRGYIPFKKQDNSTSVHPNSLPGEVGDEPLMFAQTLNCPIVIASNRAHAVQTLINAQNIDIILSDDGLQHYALGRDIEIVVLDGERQLGNGYCLPLGPLREPATRLHSVDLIITNGGGNFLQNNAYTMKLIPVNESLLKALQGKRVHAIAGIGNPQRFFQLLRNYSIQVIEHAFPDHHKFKPEEIQFADDFPIIMTAKDAVKCKAFMTHRHHVLHVQASVDSGFDAKLIELLIEKNKK